MDLNNFFRTINLVFFSFIFGIIAFSIIVFFMIEDKVIRIPTTDDIFIIIVPVTCFMGIFLSKFMFNKLQAAINSEKTTKQNVQILTSAMLVRFAIIEGPALLSVIVVLEYSNPFYYLFTAILLVYFISLKPNKEKMSKVLRLSSEQNQKFGVKDNYRQD